MSTIERILLLRDEQNLTSKDVEIGADLANSSISQWKRGRGKPSLESIVKLAHFFHVTSDYLLCLSDVRNSQPSGFEISLSEEEKLLLHAFHHSCALDRFRIIQTCMNALEHPGNTDPESTSPENPAASAVL